MVLDAIEGDLVTKSDFAVFQERVENRLSQFDHRLETQLNQFDSKLENKLESQRNHYNQRLLETEFRLITRLGFLTVSTATIAVAMLTWLIKT